MYKLLWIINLSEVQNSSYALVKGKFEEQLDKNTKDSVTSYATRDNIHEYLDKIEEYDCIIFGSNCFRDIVIWDLFNDEAIKKKMSAFIHNEQKACIFMHQLLAEGEECNLFYEIEDLKFYVKRKKSAETETGLEFTAESNNYKLYPNILKEDEIFNNAQNDPFQAGVIWETFNVEKDYWNTILQTKEGNSIIKVSKKYKVILSNMLLDEQWHFDVIENMIVNLLSGGINVGIVSNGVRKDFSYMALISELRRKHIYYTEYNWNNKEELTLLENRIDDNIHTSVIIDGNDERIKTVKEKCVDKKNITKCIQYRFDEKDNNVIVATEGISDDKLIYLSTELEVQEALGEGLIENSFSTTMKIIHLLLESSTEAWKNESDLDKIPNYRERKYIQIIEDKIKQNCNADGSYDESFGATCQMIWYYDLTKDDLKKKKAQKWLIQNYKKYYKEDGGLENNYPGKRLGIREVLDCFEACAGCNEEGISIEQEENEHIRYIYNQLQKEPFYYSTYDLVAIINFGLRKNEYDLVYRAIDIAIENSNSFDEKLKICLCITKLLKEVEKQKLTSCKNQSMYESCLSKNIREIRNWRDTKEEGFLMKRLEIAYLLCEYDDLQKIPQDFVIKMIDHNYVAFDYQQCKKAILEVQNFRIENYEMGKEIEKLEVQNNKLRKYELIHYVSLIVMVFAVYGIASLLTWVIRSNQLEDMFEAVVKNMWEFHSAAIVAIVGVIKYTFQKWFTKKYKRKDEEGE